MRRARATHSPPLHAVFSGVRSHACARALAHRCEYWQEPWQKLFDKCARNHVVKHLLASPGMADDDTPPLTTWCVEVLTPTRSNKAQSARGVSVHMLLDDYIATTSEDDPADGLGKVLFPRIGLEAMLPNGELNTQPVEVVVKGVTVVKPPGTVPTLVPTPIRFQVRSIARGGGARLRQMGDKLFYYTPSAIELEEEDPSEWGHARATLNKMRRGKKKAKKSKRDGEMSEGEVSETDSLGSLNKKARGLFKETASWGARP